MNAPFQPPKAPPSVWFPQWAGVLAQRALPPLVHRQYQTAILRYLRFCKDMRQGASVDSARQFMEKMEQQRWLSVSQLAGWKTALNWFFQEAAKQSHAGLSSAGSKPTWGIVHSTSPVMTGVPTLGAVKTRKG